MSSTGSGAPLRLELRPSRALARFLIATHAGGAACLLVAHLPPWVGWIGIFALAVSLARALPRHVTRRHPRAVVWILAGTEGDWTLGLADGSVVTAERLSGALVHPALIVLHLRCEGRRWRCSIPIAADALDPESHRRLRVRLNLEALTEPP